MSEDLAYSGKRSSTTRQDSLPEESIEDIGGSGKTKKLKKENVNDFISSRVIHDSASQTEKDENGGDRQFRAHPTETISLISIDDQNALQAEKAEPQQMILDAHFTCGNERGDLALFGDDSIQASNDSQSKLIERDSSDMESVASGTNSRMQQSLSAAQISILNFCANSAMRVISSFGNSSVLEDRRQITVSWSVLLCSEASRAADSVRKGETLFIVLHSSHDLEVKCSCSHIADSSLLEAKGTASLYEFELRPLRYSFLFGRGNEKRKTLNQPPRVQNFEDLTSGQVEIFDDIINISSSYLTFSNIFNFRLGQCLQLMKSENLDLEDSLLVMTKRMNSILGIKIQTAVRSDRMIAEKINGNDMPMIRRVVGEWAISMLFENSTTDSNSNTACFCFAVCGYFKLSQHEFARALSASHCPRESLYKNILLLFAPVEIEADLDFCSENSKAMIAGGFVLVVLTMRSAKFYGWIPLLRLVKVKTGLHLEAPQKSSPILLQHQVSVSSDG